MEKDIGKIKKNDNTDVIIRIDDFGGKIGLTIREYTTSERYTGFTKSGTRISAESFKEFKDIINSINEADMQSSHQAAEPREEQKEPEQKPKKAKKKVENPIPEEVF